MGLRRDDPCYCAVLACERGPLPENAGRMLAASGATLFTLAPGQYGLCVKQIERDLALLSRLRSGLSAEAPCTLSAGGVYRGPQGFARSLREALDAPGALFETAGAVRVYKSVDAQTAAWLALVKLPALREALAAEDPAPLDKLLADLRRAAEETRPGLFALRYMAAALDATLPMAVVDRQNARIRALWQQETPDAQAWLAAFCDKLADLRSAVKRESGEGWPAPVRSAVLAIRTRYAENLGINVIAEELRMNPAYLGQLVRRHTGVTFHRRLLTTRVEHACVLLRQTARPVGEIALEVGFRDVDYFSQQFRRLTGVSPVAYRGADEPGEDEHAAR